VRWTPQLFSDAAGPTQLEPKKYRPRRTVVLVAVAATVAAAIAIPLAVKGHNTPPPADSESGRRTPFNDASDVQTGPQGKSLPDMARLLASRTSTEVESADLAGTALPIRPGLSIVAEGNLTCALGNALG
jgi:hypothetical protein